MPSSTGALVEAVERTLFVYPAVPGLNDDIGVDGVMGRETPVSHPIANLVGCANLAASGADVTIARIRDRFAESGKCFGWVTSPSSRPVDLGNRLGLAGFLKADEIAGMVLTDRETRIPARNDVVIRPATQDEQRQAVAMMAEAYGMPADVAEWFAELQIELEGRLDSTTYHAYVAESDTPVAFGNLVFVPGTSMVLLGGAATLPDYRGQGIYTALVARRLADAWAGGADAAVIQAVRGTSAPVCTRLGFREVLALELHAWLPPGVEMDLHA